MAKSNSKTAKILAMILIPGILVLGGSGFLYYNYIYVPNQVTDYRNEVVEVQNKMMGTVEEMDAYEIKFQDLESDKEKIAEYVKLAKDYLAQTNELEAIEKYEKNNDVLKEFSEVVGELVEKATRTQELENDLVLVLEKLVMFMEVSRDLDTSLENFPDASQGAVFNASMSAYTTTLEKLKLEVDNFNEKEVKLAESESVQDNTGKYLQDAYQVYVDIKSAYEKAKRAYDENNDALGNESNNEIEAINKRVEELVGTEAVDPLFDKVNEAIDDLNEILEKLYEVDEKLLDEYEIEEA